MVLPSFYSRVLQSPGAVSVQLPATDEVRGCVASRRRICCSVALVDRRRDALLTCVSSIKQGVAKAQAWADAHVDRWLAWLAEAKDTDRMKVGREERTKAVWVLLACIGCFCSQQQRR